MVQPWKVQDRKSTAILVVGDHFFGSLGIIDPMTIFDSSCGVDWLLEWYSQPAACSAAEARRFSELVPVLTSEPWIKDGPIKWIMLRAYKTSVRRPWAVCFLDCEVKTVAPSRKSRHEESNMKERNVKRDTNNFLTNLGGFGSCERSMHLSHQRWYLIEPRGRISKLPILLTIL